MKRWLTAPALHFIIIGAILFAVQPAGQVVSEEHGFVREPIVITQEHVEQIRKNYNRETGLVPTVDDTRALLERTIHDELLYREALAHRLDLHDRSVRWRMIAKMRFLSDQHEGGDEQQLYLQARELGLDRDDVVIKRILIHKMRLMIRLQADDDIPSDEQLIEFFEENEQDYLQPARLTFSHIFLSRDKRGDALVADADALLAEVELDAPQPGGSLRYGDPFPLGQRYRSRDRLGIAKVFGEDFANATVDLEPGSWSGPIESAYGLHLVYVEETEGERVPRFESVRSQVFQRYVNERRTAHFERTVEELRDTYEVEIAEYDQGGDT